MTIAGLGLALGTLWEFAEWAYGLVGVGPRAEVFAGFSRDDTLMDLVMDFLGSTGAGILGLIMLGGRPPGSIGEGRTSD